MKKFILIFFLILLSSALHSQPQFRNNAIYVKYKSIEKNKELQSASGKYTVKKLFSNNYFANKVLTNKQSELIDELKKVVIIDFKKEIDPFKIAKVFSAYENVEYAEPIPISYLVDNETNDPELSNLYQLYLTKIVDAWQLMSGDTVTIAIVDTGIDLDHEDLENVIWHNELEMGLDDWGQDKRSNGIDDDGNGLIDDWRGWDFGSESGYDNDPTNGNDHGVHVAGIAAAESNNGIGISGVCPLAKIIPIKVGGDFGLDLSVYNEYEGLLYAASLGADVINCSWGTPGYSITHELMVETALEFGAVIVAAAGNNAINQLFYPSSFEGVVSVASTTDIDTKSGFSNYNTKIDICAPGSFLLSTIPNDEYDYKSGTSMASPVVAGAAAVIRSQYPDMTAQQITSLLKINADNIDLENPKFLNFIGSGRLNLYNAIKKVRNQAIEMIDQQIITGNTIGYIDAADTIRVDMQFVNVLDRIEKLELVVNNNETFPLEISKDRFQFTDLETNEQFEIKDELYIKIAKHLPENYTYTIKVSAFVDGEKWQDFFIVFSSNQTFITLSNEQLALTLCGNGNQGYNDYPNNSQGVGLLYGQNQNLLFEGGFMLADAGRFVGTIDGIRIRGNEKDRDFYPIDKISYSENDTLKKVYVLFNDYSEFGADLDSIDLNVKVKQESIIYKGVGLDNSILMKFELENANDYDIDSLYAGLFYDWDLSAGGDNDVIYFDTTSNTGFAETQLNSDIPIVGVKMHSDVEFNCYAIDNSGSGGEVGIYDGFTEEEKYLTLTSGKRRLSTRNNTDGSMVMSAGPINLKSKEKRTLYFSINIGKSKEDVISSAELFDEMLFYTPLPDLVESENFKIMSFVPNPLSNNQQADLKIWSREPTEVSLAVYDSRGRKILDLGVKSLSEKYNDISFKLEYESQGAYYLGIIHNGELIAFPFVLINE